MRRITRIFAPHALAASLLLSQLALAALAQNKLVTPPPPPPMAKKIPKTTTIHGESLVDNYFWMKDKANPAVIKSTWRPRTPTARPRPRRPAAVRGLALYTEMLSHVKQTDLDVPVRDNGYWYYSRTQEGKQYPVYARKPKGDARTRPRKSSHST